MSFQGGMGVRTKSGVRMTFGVEVTGRIRVKGWGCPKGRFSVRRRLTAVSIPPYT